MSACACTTSEVRWHDYILDLFTRPTLSPRGVYEFLLSAGECEPEMRDLTTMVAAHWDRFPDPMAAFELARLLEELLDGVHQARKAKSAVAAEWRRMGEYGRRALIWFQVHELEEELGITGP